MVGRSIFIVGISVFLAACGTIDAVKLRHPDSGHVVQCGPYTGVTGYTHGSTVLQQRGCIEDFRAQGYLRVDE